jgi:hypothetical protein
MFLFGNVLKHLTSHLWKTAVSVFRLSTYSLNVTETQVPHLHTSFNKAKSKENILVIMNDMNIVGRKC